MKASLFYADGGLGDSIYPGWLLLEFDMLTGLFERVGLQKNVRNTMRMVCKTFRESGVQEVEAYTRRMAGKGSSFKDI